MKTNYSTLATLTMAFGLVAFSTAISAETEAPMLPPSNAILTMTILPPPPASAQWYDIKDCTYDMRAQFFAGFKRLEARVDDQITALAAKRATMNSSTDTKDWDFAMKEVVDARSYLKSVGEELGKASLETWSQQKDKVALAWVRTQDAYGKVRSSTTT